MRNLIIILLVMISLSIHGQLSLKIDTFVLSHSDFYDNDGLYITAYLLPNGTILNQGEKSPYDIGSTELVINNAKEYIPVANCFDVSIGEKTYSGNFPSVKYFVKKEELINSKFLEFSSTCNLPIELDNLIYFYNDECQVGCILQKDNRIDKHFRRYLKKSNRIVFKFYNPNITTETYLLELKLLD